MKSIIKKLLLAAAVWAESVLAFGTICKLGLPHMEYRVSGATVWAMSLLFATAVLLMMCIAETANYLIGKFYKGDKPVFRTLMAFVSVWSVSAIVTGVMVVGFSKYASLPISMHTLILLANIAAVAAALLNCFRAYIPLKIRENNDFYDEPDEVEPSSTIMPEQLTNHIEITGGKIIPFPAQKDRRS